jgi:hypothetical protein
MTETFISGAKLCEQFYWEAVRPILDIHFPGLPHAAALIDSGSEVLGFDDLMSTDHDWGPRLMLFLSEEEHQRYAETLHHHLARQLPYEFKGYPTNFSPPDPDDNGTQILETITEGRVNHRVSIQTIAGFLAEHLGFDLTQPLQPADWLTFSEQRLLTLTAGPVYHDSLGLNETRAQFAYYPHDVWLYLLVTAWNRLGQEEHLMGRAGLAGDEVGSALLGARLVRDVMRLCFLMERSYAPYPKWFGTGFKRLRCGPALYPVLQAALAAATWQARETHLVKAYETIATMHNALGLTEPLPEQTTSFFGRPFQVIAFHGFTEALLKQIEDPEVKRIAKHSRIGSLDQFSDSTDLVSDPRWRPWVRQLYQ